jgi:hypothetical protein
MSSESRSVEDLTQFVEALFRAHSKRYCPPSLEGCRTVATALMVVRRTEDAKAQRKDLTKAPIVAARKSAKDLLRNLKPIRWKLECLVADAESWGQSDAGYREPLDRLNAAANAVEALLIEIERPPIAPISHRDPIRFIAEKVQEAWAQANEGAWPTSKNPNDPLVRVVVNALSLVGMMRVTPNAVSAVLRGERRTKDKNRY